MSAITRPNYEDIGHDFAPSLEPSALRTELDDLRVILKRAADVAVLDKWAAETSPTKYSRAWSCERGYCSLAWQQPGEDEAVLAAYGGSYHVEVVRDFDAENPDKARTKATDAIVSGEI